MILPAASPLSCMDGGPGKHAEYITMEVLVFTLCLRKVSSKFVMSVLLFSSVGWLVYGIFSLCLSLRLVSIFTFVQYPGWKQLSLLHIYLDFWNPFSKFLEMVMWLLRERKVWNQYVQLILCVLGWSRAWRIQGPKTHSLPPTHHYPHTQHIHHGLLYQALRIQKAMRCKNVEAFTDVVK